MAQSAQCGARGTRGAKPRAAAIAPLAQRRYFATAPGRLMADGMLAVHFGHFVSDTAEAERERARKGAALFPAEH